jgi:hypothetical protein
MGSLKYESIRNQLDELMGPNRNGDLKAESIISVRRQPRKGPACAHLRPVKKQQKILTLEIFILINNNTFINKILPLKN